MTLTWQLGKELTKPVSVGRQRIELRDRTTENDKECKYPKTITSDLVGCLAKDCLLASAMNWNHGGAEWCQIYFFDS